MFNNLGIFSSRFPQGLRPGINLRKLAVRTFQVSGRRGGGVNTIVPVPPPLLLRVTGTTPQVTTSESGTVIVTGMTLTWPITSNALATFNADFSIVGPTINITAAGAAATTALAVQLAALPGGIPHGAVLGNGETLAPGVYDIVTPASIQGILTLNGGGNPNALFVIRVAGALTSVAASQVQLTNGAQAKNVFFVSQGATALGANTIFRGTALAVGGAATLGNGSTMTGRLLSTIGAVNTDTSVVTEPGATTTPVVLGVLETFALFTNNGAVANTGTSVINGNIGTNVGAITGYGLPSTVNGTIYPPGATAAGPVSASFGIYKNGVLVPASLVTVSGPTTIPSGHVTTTATIPLVPGDIITARSTVTAGTMTVTNRSLSLQQV